MNALQFVVMVLAGNGPKGVETHFNATVTGARKRGIDTRVVSAQYEKKWKRRRSAWR